MNKKQYPAKTFVVSAITLFLLLQSAWVFATGWPPPEPEITKPCVVMLGDSIFNFGYEPDIIMDLAGDTYRTYYQGGAQLVGSPLGIPSILDQYETAISEGPIRTIIADGGGNDILFENHIACIDCNDDLWPACEEAMDERINALRELATTAAHDGIENLVLQGYYYCRYPWLWTVTDVFQQKAVELMEEMRITYPWIKIVFVDPREHPDFAVPGQNPHLFIDGIHPTEEADEILANMVWDAMVENGIEQQNQRCP